MVQKIRVNFKAFDTKQLDQAIKNIIMIVRKSGAKIIGPVPLPTKIKKFCVLRSPHVDKKSREQFEVRTHKRLMYIYNTTQNTMNSLTQMEMSPGVKVDIKLIDSAKK